MSCLCHTRAAAHVGLGTTRTSTVVSAESHSARQKYLGMRNSVDRKMNTRLDRTRCAAITLLLSFVLNKIKQKKQTPEVLINDAVACCIYIYPSVRKYKWRLVFILMSKLSHHFSVQRGKRPKKRLAKMVKTPKTPVVKMMHNPPKRLVLCTYVRPVENRPPGHPGWLSRHFSSTPKVWNATSYRVLVYRPKTRLEVVYTPRRRFVRLGSWC